ncbi:hypothetical protein [Thermoactinomyces sp. DSM 45892]|uniref:hypothetical protein n=1 Tax=Thermoactinomyces sp. DSM 45892 TaxID=1882753 RepID=UPI00089B814C|nr:hypothetical protein [Thermoactinomyces sp. DSM 45892]SDY68927.1 hypothetical protein SAMN05444416_10781 [Thermoactinomyces sp. DSM 45892]
MENQLRKIGWLVYPNCEAFQFQLTRNHHIFIFKEGEGWLVWTATYKAGDGNGIPIKEKTRIDTFDFYTAVENAHEYIAWYRNNIQRREWKPPEIKREEF